MIELDREIAKKLCFDWPEYGTPFSPSSRIDHAWLVVEEMERRGYDWIIEKDGGNLMVTFWGKQPSTFHYHDCKVPEAICRAALEALKNDNS